MRIAEIFRSIQGEGVHIGTPTIFVRFTGCNLRCKWCDTKYAYNQGKEMKIYEIITEIRQIDCKTICLTGGEPLFQKDECLALMVELLKGGNKIVFETNGSLDIGDIIDSAGTYFRHKPLKNLSISMDWKLPSSGENDKMVYKNLALLRSVDQIKFVISDKRDYDIAKTCVLSMPEPKFEKPACVFQLATQGNEINNEVYLTSLKNLSEVVLQDNLPVVVLPQLHKLLWGNRRSV